MEKPFYPISIAGDSFGSVYICVCVRVRVLCGVDVYVCMYVVEKEVIAKYKIRVKFFNVFLLR